MLHLHVKFRIFGQDLGNIDQMIPVPELNIVPPRVLFNGHGVLLEIIRSSAHAVTAVNHGDPVQ